jgi:uncharacterized protein with GYD domain
VRSTLHARIRTKTMRAFSRDEMRTVIDKAP